MAEMKIVLSKIERIEPHDNADRLEIAFIDTNDFPVIVGKDQFTVGDNVIHFPVDCVIPDKLEVYLLGSTKIKLSNGRIRASKIRGVVSYGILTSAEKLSEYCHVYFTKDKDYMKTLGCIKYEPPNIKSPRSGVKQASKKNSNPYFDKYFNMNHIQNCKGIFNGDDDVIVTEKLHGTSFRCGYLPRALKWWQKPFKRFINKYEFTYGSRNIQLTEDTTSIYKDIVIEYNLKTILKKYPNVAIYGEIVGPNIQKGYIYTKDLTLWIYDIKIDGSYVSDKIFRHICDTLNVFTVPIVYIGKFQDIPYKKIFSTGSLFQAGGTECKTKEGVVIQGKEEKITKHGRNKVKYINPEYLLNKNNTDHH